MAFLIGLDDACLIFGVEGIITIDFRGFLETFLYIGNNFRGDTSPMPPSANGIMQFSIPRS